MPMKVEVIIYSWYRGTSQTAFVDRSRRGATYKGLHLKLVLTMASFYTLL